MVFLDSKYEKLKLFNLKKSFIFKFLFIKIREKKKSKLKIVLFYLHFELIPSRERV
jgi:hypothetical protein